MNKYLICILSVALLLTSCKQNLTTAPLSTHTNQVVPILYYEQGSPPKINSTSTSIIKSGKLENYENYTRGSYPRAVPISKFEKIVKEHNISKNEWQLKDYVNYPKNEICILINNDFSEYLAINNGEIYKFPSCGEYNGVKIENNNLYIFEVYGDDYVSISIRELNLLTGESTTNKINFDRNVTLGIEQLYLHNKDLYFIDYDVNSEKKFLSKYNIETKAFDYYKPDYWLGNFFLLEDKIVLVGATPEYHLVIDTIGYGFLSEKIETYIPPNNNGAIRYVGNADMAMLNHVIYGTLGDENGNQPFFGFNIITNEWTDIIPTEKPNINNNHLMAVLFNYIGNNNELFELIPHINNLK